MLRVNENLNPKILIPLITKPQYKSKQLRSYSAIQLRFLLFLFKKGKWSKMTFRYKFWLFGLKILVELSKIGPCRAFVFQYIF